MTATPASTGQGARARGVLHLVAGPSGSGKDSLMEAARAARPDILFPRRTITREADAGGEDHIPATRAEFEAAEAAGRFALSWRAHGLAYGIPLGIEAALSAGRHVCVNVSRAAIPEARARFAPIRALIVTAPADVLARRLAARGREPEEEVARRLARAAYAVPDAPELAMIANDSTLEEGAARFLAALAPAPTEDAARKEDA
ncbi:phosphonate metabolism protein/1,5-bisphosphokinase (PRPP-forming) PhnN [Rhodovulum sp. DZ06]|uniref:phosphonate metabolism protein/1,5-bisphosphokinase (PRPP-forming) PhnN n=1 Tax=Rhodovulum sp. DZ06 TaxID=3425126 RepID=UPI003D356ECD